MLIGVSTKIGIFNEKKFQFQEGKFDPFGTATIGTFSYDIPVSSLILILVLLYIPKFFQEYILHFAEVKPWQWIRSNVF